MLIERFLKAETASGNEKIQGLDLTKITFKLEHINNTWTNETNNITRDDGNSYEGNKRETLDNIKGNMLLNVYPGFFTILLLLS